VYISDYNLLQAAGIEQPELQGGYRAEPFNSGQLALIAALYLGQKIDELAGTISSAQTNPTLQQVQSSLNNLDNALMAVARVLDDTKIWLAVDNVSTALTRIIDFWKEKHEMPQMRALLQKVRSYHRRQS
jgi:hypothetical protein